MTNEETVSVIDSLVKAYNNSDLDRFMTHFADDAKIVHDYDIVVQDGSEAIRASYMQPLADKHQVNVMQRIAIGRHVVDLACVTKPNASAAVNFLTIYTLDLGKVARVDFIDHGFVRQASSLDGGSGRDRSTLAEYDPENWGETQTGVRPVGSEAHDRSM